jgi:hypothetical protein
LVPPKSNEGDHKHAKDFEHMHSVVRSRIERKFADLMRWRIFIKCCHGPKWLAKALRIITAVEFMRGCCRAANPYPSLHVVREADLRNWADEPECSCEFAPPDNFHRAEVEAHRKGLMDKIARSGLYKGVEDTKPPSKGGHARRDFVAKGPGKHIEKAFE